ncbi:hypothetical protein K8I31_13880, partial [bacterium]|nr:hypothetical protein [bacterium]
SNSMIDYLSPDSVGRFISLTHEQYAKRYENYFGNVVPGIFSDEPSTMSPSSFAWTFDFADAYKKKYGRSLLDDLPYLLDPESPKGPQVRMAYMQTAADLFTDRFFGSISQWCQNHDLAFTGHIFEENIESYASAPQIMNHLRKMDIPGMDALGPMSKPSLAKVVISVAQLEGKEEALCESLGLARGWNCNLNTLRTGYNILGSFGISRFVPHAFFQTIDNPRVECPPDFFYRNPYWKYYRQIADLTSRLSYFNHLGEHVAPAAVYYPIESLWADSVGGKGQNVLPWQHRTVGNKDAEQTINVFNDLTDKMFYNRWDFAVVDDSLLERADVLADRDQVELAIHNEQFRVVIVPPVTAIGVNALRKLDAYMQAGGRVVWLERLPQFVWPMNESAKDEPAATLQRWIPDGNAKVGQEYQVGKGSLVLRSGDADAVVAYLNDALSPEFPVRGEVDAVHV